MIAHWALFPEYAFLGAMGAASLEWLKNYELQNKLEKKKYERLIKSSTYWLKFFLFIFASGFIAWAMNENNPNSAVWQIVMSGISANALINQSSQALLSKERLHAGEEEKISISDLF
ncbi:MAG: hypothetical protein Q8Q54_16375 [Methylococcales bacterium]|nr:hypothetical protein [Methylococcales bacterium]MDP3840495.1 hypothetical protein [Methylococcales bacterium]